MLTTKIIESPATIEESAASPSSDHEWWELLVETQTCIWASSTGGPEVVPEDGMVLENFDSEPPAIDAAESHLAQLGATAEWSDVRPIEKCTQCGQDFSTLTPHKVLTIAHCRGSEEDAVTLDVKYPARFCNACVPCSSRGR